MVISALAHTCTVTTPPRPCCWKLVDTSFPLQRPAAVTVAHSELTLSVQQKQPVVQFGRKKNQSCPNQLQPGKHRSSLLRHRKVLGFRGFTWLHSTFLATSVQHAVPLTFGPNSLTSITIILSVLSYIGSIYAFRITNRTAGPGDMGRGGGQRDKCWLHVRPTSVQFPELRYYYDVQRASGPCSGTLPYV